MMNSGREEIIPVLLSLSGYDRGDEPIHQVDGAKEQHGGPDVAGPGMPFHVACHGFEWFAEHFRSGFSMACHGYLPQQLLPQ